MAASDFVQITVSLTNSATPTVEAFGTPMLVAQLSPAAVTQNPARFRVYSSGSALTEALADGILTTDPVYRALEVALSQPQVPPQIAIGRRANLYTQVLHMTCTDVGTVNPYEATFIGSDGISHTYGPLISTGVPATDAASFAALMTASNIGAVTVSSATIAITQAAGKLTDIQLWTPNFTIADVTATPGSGTGLSGDLAAILAANNLGWYGYALDSNSKAEVESSQAFAEATGQGGKIAFYNNSDTANCTAGSGDLNSFLQSETYNRCLLLQDNSEILGYTGFGLLAQLLAYYPGSYNPAYKAIPGALADTDQTLTETQALVLNTMSTSSPGPGGKNGNYYKTTSGLNLTWPGCAPGARFIDATIFLDWFQATTQAAVLAVQAGSLKVPETNFGIGRVTGTIKSQIKVGGNAPYNGIDLTQDYGVTAPTIDEISETNLADRNLTGISAFFTLSGAWDTIEVGVTVVP